MQKINLVPLLLAIVLIALMVPIPAPVSAQGTTWDIYVNDTRDIHDFGINSVCDADFAAPNDQCTLRAALDEANYWNLGDDAVYIHLPAGHYTLTLSGRNENDNETGDLDITQTNAQIIIEGAGPGLTIIDASALDRVFDLRPNAWVDLRSLTITGGRTEVPTDPFAYGAGIYNDDAFLTLDSVIIENNSVVCLPGTDNCSQASGGGLFNRTDDVAVNQTIIRNNSATRGGGIFNTNSDTAPLVLINSTISGNHATIAGGGIINYGAMRMINDTVSGNTAGGTSGGVSNESVLYLANVTIARNSAAYNAANLHNVSGATLYLKNSIIADALGSDYVTNCDGTGTWNTAGYNISDDATCHLTAGGDQTNTDPLLTPLAYLGGLTPTHGLLPGSPASNNNPTGCTDFNGFTISTDQRGYNRDFVGCDAGAFEGLARVVNLPAILR
ncbi:MAG: hypothetical protein KA928_01325 [Longilinea sp.]|jgi:hypothetical protein|nr:hypothetical protein [Longilinea sp.]